MKKIIAGKKYDTNTAKILGSAGYSHPGDFSFWTEQLYCKRTGEFFLYGVGGPMSKYSRSVDCNTFTGGEEIIPLTVKEAQKWAEKYLEVEEYELIFGACEE